MRVGGLQRRTAVAAWIEGDAEARHDAVCVGADDVARRLTVRLFETHAEIEGQIIGRCPAVLDVDRQRGEVHRGACRGQPVLYLRNAWDVERDDPSLRVER